MIKRLLFAAIATTVMVGCTEDPTSNNNTTADLPVNISYNNAEITEETHDAYAKIEKEDGTVITKKLDIDQNGISGVISNIDGDELCVSVEVFDAEGKLRWKGSDIVEREEDSFENVHTDLFRVDETGAINTQERIKDENGIEEKLQSTDLSRYLALLFEVIDIDPSLRDELKNLVAGREWTENEILLIEEFLKLISSAQNSDEAYVEWDHDTLFIDEAGNIVKEGRPDTDDETTTITYDFLSEDAIWRIIKEISSEYNIPAEALADIVKSKTTLFTEKTPARAKEEVYLHITKIARLLTTEMHNGEITTDEDSSTNSDKVNPDGTIITDNGDIEPAVKFLSHDDIFAIIRITADRRNVPAERVADLINRETSLFSEPVSVTAKEEVYSVAERYAEMLAGSNSEVIINPDDTIREDGSILNDEVINQNGTNREDGTVGDPETLEGYPELYNDNVLSNGDIAVDGTIQN